MAGWSPMTKPPPDSQTAIEDAFASTGAMSFAAPHGLCTETRKGDAMSDLLFSVMTLLAQAGEDNAAAAGRAIALGVGGGLGAVGAGVGIGTIFGKVIESVTRQPEMRDEITGIQWLGFALTEACFFYGLVAGLIAFFLS
jgi:F-type H+-transporting ATPase subunit c